MAAAEFENDEERQEQGPSLEEQLASERALRERAEADAQAARRDRERESARLDDFLRGDRVRTPEPTPLGPMPDPAAEPEKFAAWLDERDKRREAEYLRGRNEDREQTEARITEESRAARLWQLFTTKYPEHASLGDLAGVAFKSIDQDAHDSEDSLLDAVASRMDKMAGRKIGARQETDRTGGLSGGEQPRPKREAPKDDGEGSSTMHDAISSWKQKNGFI